MYPVSGYLIRPRGVKMPNNIRSERARLGLSQKELAERIGVDESTVTRWEKDIGPMSVKFLREMSELFSCTTDYIVGRSQERTISRA